uniref:Uncharacterized protein n=1 Tax=Romanomermis culicivorax TaxID=13658 RepID=A0A915HGZ9_ROMCU
METLWRQKANCSSTVRLTCYSTPGMRNAIEKLLGAYALSRNDSLVSQMGVDVSFVVENFDSTPTTFSDINQLTKFKNGTFWITDSEFGLHIGQNNDNMVEIPILL